MDSIIFKISIRNLLKNKFTSSVSVFGLTVGFIAFILISLFIRYELSWDKANENFDRIYIVQRNTAMSAQNTGSGNITPLTPAITATLVGEYQEFEKVTSVYPVEGSFLSTSAERQNRIGKGIYADHNYFDIFTYHFINGHAGEEFMEPFSVAISETLANRLFNSIEAAGKVVTLDRRHDLIISGVYADLPLNSSVRPEYIISFPTLERTRGITRNDIAPASFMTFVLLRPGSDPLAAASGIRDLFTGYEGMRFETLMLGKLADMRFESVPDYYAIIYIFGLMGLFILSMSVFNYVNLSIANSSTRGKEIAVKKMTGSSRSRLVVQFLGETVLLSVIAVAIAFYIVTFLLPFYNNIMNTAISLDFVADWRFVGILVAGSLIIGLLAGIYPAFHISSNRIVNLFRGDFKAGGDRIRLRKILVLFQFAISVFLICLSLFFLKQVNHLAGKDTGFDRENMVYLQLTSSAEGKYFEDLRNRLLQNPSILNASMSANLPFVNFGAAMISREGGIPGDKVLCRPNRVTYDFVRNMGMKIVEGRDFSRDYHSDIEQACIINETAVRVFGWDDPIGKRLDDNRYRVTGVVRDYHVMDIHNPIDPVVLILAPGEMKGSWTYAIRYAPGSRDEAIRILDAEFSREFPDDPFEIEELESAFLNENAYKGYQTVKKSILLFTAFSIFLAVTGLLGLVSFSIVRRTKEIGIRKISGCPEGKIFILLNREFFILLGISLVVAWPGVWMVHNAFPGAYKLPLHGWILLASALIIATVTLLVTGWQTWRAATRNPVEFLRYE